MAYVQKSASAPGDPYFTGNGKYDDPSGWSYDGQWFEGMPHGRGIYVDHDGGVYKGSFENSHQHGYGKMIHKKLDGSIQFIYKGYWYESSYCGWGILTDEVTFKYEGEFSEGISHGKGTYTDLFTGKVSEGTYYKNVPRGDFKMTFPSGSIFKGTILQNLTKSLDSYESFELFELTRFYTGRIIAKDGKK